MKLPRWYIIRYHKRCLIEIVDMATGVSSNCGVHVTAFKWKCVLCGREFDDITESGFGQLVEGHKKEDVFKWISRKRLNPNVPMAD